MALLIQCIVNGLTVGSTYALVALGYVIIYKASRVLNFAQGDLLMLGAMLALVMTLDLQVPYVATFIVVILVMFLLGIVVERIAYRPLLKAPEFTVILSTVAVGQMIRSGVRYLRGNELRLVQPMVSTDPMQIAGITLTPLELTIIGLSLLLVLGFSLFFGLTPVGAAMRAVSQNQTGASLVGISVPRMYAFTWAIASAFAAAAGILMAPILIVSPDMGVIGLKGFVGAILGGFTSLPGAVVGGFLLGIIENLAGIYISSAFKDVFTFAVLLLVLTVRPTGLFGKSATRRV